MVAERYGTEHHEFVVQPDAVDLVEKLVWHHDQPFGDSSAIPTYPAGRADARPRHRRALRRRWRRAVRRLRAVRGIIGCRRLWRDSTSATPRLPTRAGRRPGGALHGRVGNIRRFAAAAERGMPDAYLEWVSFIDEPTRRALLEDPDPWGRDDFASQWSSTSTLAPLDRVLDLNLRTYLLDDLLVKADRMSMAHGLELRSPLLDIELASYAIQLPPKFKIGAFSLKRALKHGLRDDLPREVLRRRKHGFGVPLDRWFREDLRGYVGHMLGSPRPASADTSGARPSMPSWPSMLPGPGSAAAPYGRC